MALATTCPRCRTSFKVVPDQLKLRRGLVRCGACHHVFSGVDYLRYVDESSIRAGDATCAPDDAITREPAPAAASTAEALAPEPLAPEPVAPEPVAPEPVAPEPVAPEPVAPEPVEPEPVEPEPVEPEAHTPGALAPAPPAPNPVDPVVPESGEPASVAPPATAAQTAESIGSGPADADVAIDEHVELDEFVADADRDAPDMIAAEPLAHAARFDDGEADAVDTGAVAAGVGADADAIDYFGGNRRGRGFETRGAAFAWGAAALLTLTLALQIAIGTRDWLAAWAPALRPAIVAMTAPLGLAVQPPRALDALTIESFELLESSIPGLYGMSALLRNGAAHPVRWPALELTLVDGSGAILARKVLHPADYLGAAASSLSAGVPAKSEQPVRGALETSDLAPTGYSVKVFYP